MLIRSRLTKKMRGVLVIGVIASGIASVAFVNRGAQAAPEPTAVEQAAGLTRSEVVARAQDWIDKNVRYSQSGYHPDVDGKSYRTDCSGYVSMAWGLSSSETTMTLPGITSKLGSAEDLLPGDIILKPGKHVGIFIGWASSGQAIVYHEARAGVGTVEAVWNVSSRLKMGYGLYRYDRILEDPVPEPEPEPEVTPEPEPVAPPEFLGVVEDVEPSAGSVHVVGWAVDPKTTDTSTSMVSVKVTVDSAVVATVEASGKRPDVTSTTGLSQPSGFDATVPVPAGSHEVCVVAQRELGSDLSSSGIVVGNTTLGCTTVDVP